MRRESSGAAAPEKGHKRKRARSGWNRTEEGNSAAHLLSQLTFLPHSKAPSQALSRAHTRRHELLDPKSSPARARWGAKDHQMEMMSARPLLAALLLPALLLSAASAADSKNNPADQLVALVNSNRTASKASSLSDNQGLGCIALQYIKAYEGQCNQVSGKKPMESSFTDTFAPNCGVQATTLSKITGRLVGCQSKYAAPAEAFDILVNDAKGLQVLHSKNHTEVGAAVSGTDGGGPYFWCILFSDGKPTTSFKVDGEVPKAASHPGCFSGNNDDCMGATSGTIFTSAGASRLVAAALLAVACALAL